MKDMKKYDRLLRVKRNLDGSKQIFRDSPFNSQRSFEILNIENKYIGSFSWIRKHLISIDNQRFDITGASNRNNMAIRNKNPDDRLSRELADFILSGGDSIVL